MAYRLCTFDSFGKIVSVSPESYPSDSINILNFTALNPSAYALIDESLLPTNIYDNSTSGTSDELIFDGADVRIQPRVKAEDFDPRVEVTLFMPNPHPYFARGTKIVQDITKAAVVYNTVAPETKPIHSLTTYKFGAASAKFTRSSVGYTGGFIYLTNLSKRTQSSFTAPHNNIGGGLTCSWGVELFFYPTSTANNFSLLQKGPTGASANWKLGFDSSAGQLQFAWQGFNSSAGYNYTQNIINTAGLTTNTWHHVAVALVKNGSGVSYLMSGYFNGVNKFTQSITSSATLPEVRFNHGLYIGNNSLGNESFNGYIDSLRILESPSTGGIFGPTGYGFLPFGGGTLGVPTLSGFTRNSEACVVMNFNNLPDTSDFYVESTEFISATVRRITDLVLGPSGPTNSANSEIGVAQVVRYTIGATGATGLSDATGFSTNYGAICAPFFDTTPAGSTNVVHGYDYAYPLNGIYDNAPDIDVYRTTYRNDQTFDLGLELMTTIEGCRGNTGSSGSIYDPRFGQNPFRRLFSGQTGASGNCYGVGLVHTSLFLNPLDSTTMQYIMNNGYLATQGICLSSYAFLDARGLTRTVTATDISNLRLDIMEYQNNIVNGYRGVNAQINAASSKNVIKTAVKNKPYNTTLNASGVLGKDSILGDGGVSSV